MVLEVWPETLPRSFMVSGYQEVGADNLIKDEYNVGPPSYRRRTVSAPASFAGQMLMTIAQWEILSAFFHTTLFDGVKRFLFPPQGYTDISHYWVSRFIAPPQRQLSAADDGWFVSLELERLAIGQSFLLPARLISPTTIYAPNIIWDQVLIAARYNNANTFYAPSTPNDKLLTPSRLNNTNSFFSASFSGEEIGNVFDSDVFDVGAFD